jgi:glycogen debranching enzyme
VDPPGLGSEPTDQPGSQHGYGDRGRPEHRPGHGDQASQGLDRTAAEVFCGFDRGEIPVPVPYPTSCSPQAWAAGVPYEILRIAVGLEADVPRGMLSAAPTTGVIGEVRIEGLRLGDRTVSLHADDAAARLEGWPQG